MELDKGDRKKGTEESSNLLRNSKGNLITAASDDNLNEIFRQLKTSKTPVSCLQSDSSCILPVEQQVPKLSFVYADIDECPETTQHIRYTPTFHFYRDGERVDEMFGAGEERLHDRLWLHS
ncbi:UNVERIFIED_CONTAM: Thioredoxin-like 3-3 [Sesamum angustifolium]|uniref:Thioredoxin-like 3-3 n=1 Tax=Sesamum angustifolium TaxID=2727405 RepID=A0AAW2MP09_9LAMI